MNLDLVAQVGALIGTGRADPDEDLFAPDFVFHFVNPHLPGLDGDHHGFEGMRSLAIAPTRAHTPPLAT